MKHAFLFAAAFGLLTAMGAGAGTAAPIFVEDAIIKQSESFNQ